VARLTLQGLVFSSGVPTYGSQRKKLDFCPGQVLVVPEPLRGSLSEPLLPTLEWGRGNLPAPVEETSAALAQRELFLYWTQVRNQPVPLTQAGWLHKRPLRSINENLLSPDPALAAAANEGEAPRLHFLRLLLQELGLLQVERGQLRAPGPRRHVPQFWHQSLAQRAQACLDAWQRMRGWSELASLRMDAFDLDLPRARTLLLTQLSSLPPGVWLSSERFLSRLAIVVPGLLFSAHHPLPLSPYHEGENSATYYSRRLAEIEGALVGGALRINSSGAQVLCRETTQVGRAARGQGEPAAKVVVQPNFEVLALGLVSEATLAQLELFADRTKADRSALAYSLTRETVHRGLREGQTVQGMLQFLEQVSSEVPQNVQRTLQEWGQQHERITFHHGVTLLQAASPQLLDALLGDGAVDVHVQRRLTPTVAVVARGRGAALKDLLVRRSLLPAHSYHLSDCDGHVEASPDGELCPLYPGPDMLLDACLRRLAEVRDGRYFVTESAVRNALAGGATVREYLEQLARVNRGPLPAALEQRIKAWGHYYGKASLRQATLLEVQDAATAAELLADAEVGTLLSPFPFDPRGRLLQVKGEDLDELGQLLQQRGIELDQETTKR
jgi:hypothetical protein